MTSKIMNFCFKQFGREYLQTVLGPVLMELVRLDAGSDRNRSTNLIDCLMIDEDLLTKSDPIQTDLIPNENQLTLTNSNTNLSYEVDPRRLQTGENLEENQKNLIFATELLYSKLISSVDM